LQVAGAATQFIEQARVLHRDDRLRREVLYEGNLLVGKGTNLAAIGRDGTEQLIVFAQRHDEVSPNADLGGDPRSRIVGALSRHLPNIIYVDERLALDQPGKRVARAGMKAEFVKLHPRIMDSRPPEAFTVIGEQHTGLGSAEAMRLIQHRFEHRFEVTRRAVDDLQYFGGRSLLLQGLACLGKSRAFSIAITACAAKFCSRAICLSVNGRTS